MKKIILVVAVVFLISMFYIRMVSPNSLEIGDSIPAFTLQDQNGTNFNIDSFKGKNIMVIYFYPKDDTPGCTKEACSFRDAYEDFTNLDVKVIGISGDNVASHKKFSKKYKLPFTLLADIDNKVRTQFGVPKSLLGLIPGRVTYIVNKNGIIHYIFNSQFNAEKHIKKSMSILKMMKNVQN